MTQKSMKIDHIAVYCKDLEKMRNFFTAYFGASSNEPYHNPRTGLRTYFLSFPGNDTKLEIMTRPGLTGQHTSQYSTGYVHLSFSVGGKEHVDRLTQQLSTAGYAVTDGPRTTGNGHYESCILGPEDIQIEIAE